MKHSPGPFTVDRDAVQDAEGNTIHTQHWSRSGEPEYTDERAHADAVLFAAAPALLKALKRWVRGSYCEATPEADEALIASIEDEIK